MRSHIVQITASTTDAVALPPNPDRRAILVTFVSSASLGSGTVLVNFGRTAAEGLGVLWGPGANNPYGGVMPLNVAYVGEQIKQDVHVATTVGSAVISILDTFE